MNPIIDHQFSPYAIEGAHERFPNNSVDFFESSDFSVNCSSVGLIEEIAKGSFGVVYHGTLDGTSYAVKIEDFHDGDEDHREDQVNLLVELTILQSLPHPRLVKFIGAGCDNNKVMIVMELCSRGTLRDVLLLNLPWKLRIRIALDVARGILFLHEQDIIHRDVKTTNILITQEWEAKLCDFSFSCHEESSSKNRFVYGTTEFMSPEISLATDFTISADIFSFGIVLCELITGKKPCESFMNRCARDMFCVDGREVRENIEEGCPERLEVLASQCCEGEPASRPTIHSCLEELEALLEALGGSDVELLSKESVKYNVESSDSSDKSCDVDTVISMNKKGSELTYDMDVNTRLSVLTLQIEELRNDNNRMNKELKILNSRKDSWVGHCFTCENIQNTKIPIGNGSHACHGDTIHFDNNYEGNNTNGGSYNNTLDIRNQDNKFHVENGEDINPINTNDSLLIFLNKIQNQLNSIKKAHIQQLDEHVPPLQLPLDVNSVQSADLISYLTGSAVGSMTGSGVGSGRTNGGTGRPNGDVRDLRVDAQNLDKSLNKDSMFRIVNQDTGEVMDLRNMDPSIGSTSQSREGTDSMPISTSDSVSTDYPLTLNQKKAKRKKEKKRLDHGQKTSLLPHYVVGGRNEDPSIGSTGPSVECLTNELRYKNQHAYVSNMLSTSSIGTREEIKGSAISKYMSSSEYDPANNLQSTLNSYLDTITKANHHKNEDTSNGRSDLKESNVLSPSRIPHIQAQPPFRSSAQIRMNSLSAKHVPSVFDPTQLSPTDADIDEEEDVPLGRTADSTDSLVGLHTR
mmetsp:Transcript_25952/g.24802  ORF Transcript_25952/g.24802 Transcript_25952/m.24802 type:complete len:803 (-) Transcript_25952:141-2549(-)|eukprot:CAMPEP_0119050564 /NCGR_PEP_ID=MMETSP1177-20130426/70613_1 /TAXON_ID=2985 /ORGANISM="Ochromonas sp, Strain CCMP1899" /LENGTH=802 /DNA_ID=CAMNT_0007029105 /DNA_START=443 /DNA_END=2851 /DNA_ORIENTATION=-